MSGAARPDRVAAAGPAAVRGRDVSAPVVEVLLMEDRAHVTRRGRIDLGEGSHRLRIAAVSPVLADKTLTALAWCSPAGNGRERIPARVDDVRVRRDKRVLLEERSEEVRALDEEILALREQAATVEAKRDVARSELHTLGELGELTLGEIGEDAAWARGSSEGWSAALDRVADAERELVSRGVDLEFELGHLGEHLERKLARRKSLSGPGDQKAAWLELDLNAAAAGEHEIVVSYVVPSACWRPRHSARLLSGSASEPRVRFECEGSAWQNTGEDWLDVTLVFSTERASLGAEPPLLASDVLSVTRKNPALVVQEREQVIEHTGLGAGAARADGLPGIDDDGDVQRLRGPHKASVPSDGRPYRVPLFSFESAAQTELVSMPELAEAVILKSVQENTSEHPILAGPVDLVQESGFVGRTSLLYVAPGEKFALGWGPDSALRVQREVEQLKEESSFTGSWITRAQEVRVHFSNLGRTPKEIRVTERVPVSEIEKVVITPVPRETTEGKRPDERGFVEWAVHLAPMGRGAVRLRYVIKKHSDVAGV